MQFSQFSKFQATMSFFSLFQKKIPERRNSDETFINYILEAMEDVQVGEVSKEVQTVRENVGLQIFLYLRIPISINIPYSLFSIDCHVF